MSLRTGLFDSTQIVQTVEGYPRGDKAETADFFAHYFYGMVGNGLDALVANNFKIETQSGMILLVNPGSAYIKGYHAFDESQATLTISSSSSLRTLYVVLRLNTQDGEITLQYTDAFTRAGAVYDIALARLDIPGNTVEIIPAMITDLRTNANFCGFIRKMTDENAEQLQQQIGAHTTNTAIHVTATDKDNWNKAAEVDYIVEQGTYGIWTYRRWNSGIAECWGSVSHSKAMTTAWGSLYSTGALGSVGYPFAFIEVPVESVTISQRSGSTCFLVSEGAGNASKSQTADYSAVRVNSDATVRTLVLNYRAIGRWK